MIGSTLAFQASKTGLVNKKALFYLGIGYASFILPTTAVYWVDPTTISGIPSIMCGFAVLLAFCLIFGVITNVKGMETQRRSVFQRFINDN